MVASLKAFTHHIFVTIETTPFYGVFQTHRDCRNDIYKIATKTDKIGSDAISTIFVPKSRNKYRNTKVIPCHITINFQIIMPLARKFDKITSCEKSTGKDII